MSNFNVGHCSVFSSKVSDNKCSQMSIYFLIVEIKTLLSK
ncbi:hypothetical protein ENTCAN_09148 [Enterobacter cancerogenus ATCC 35316]|nr:hypothetical protein ENTCAN_09148 [Enterobacter cancerogenus ATCC 35316]